MFYAVHLTGFLDGFMPFLELDLNLHRLRVAHVLDVLHKIVHAGND